MFPPWAWGRLVAWEEPRAEKAQVGGGLSAGRLRAARAVAVGEASSVQPGSVLRLTRRAADAAGPRGPALRAAKVVSRGGFVGRLPPRR